MNEDSYVSMVRQVMGTLTQQLSDAEKEYRVYASTHGLEDAQAKPKWLLRMDPWMDSPGNETIRTPSAQLARIRKLQRKIQWFQDRLLGLRTVVRQRIHAQAEYVALLGGISACVVSAPVGALTTQEKLLVKQRRKIQSIKAYRQRTGCSLKEAMALVNKYQESLDT